MARPWESIISYEDRGYQVTTSRWRLAGVKTKEGAQNTLDGVLWLKVTTSGSDSTLGLYKAAACASGDQVAAPAAAVDLSGCDNDIDNAVQVTFAASNSSGLTGALWVHEYVGDADDTADHRFIPIQVALATDEDLDALWDGVEDLPGFDATYGCAEFIRIAQEDVLAAVMQRYKDEMGGHGSGEGWFIQDADRAYPDLRRIANPGQLRLACAHRAIAIAVGRSHQRADATMYSELRDDHNERFAEALVALVVAFKAGSSPNAEASANASVIRQARV